MKSHQTACPKCGELNPDEAPSCAYCGMTWSGTIGQRGSTPEEVDGRDQDKSEWRPNFTPDERYRLMGELGEGGAGKVYRAYDRGLRRYVAYKVLKSMADPEAVQRFISECQAAAQLQHPAIVPIYDIGIRTDRTIYYTMKVVEGETLKAHIARIRDGNPAHGMTRFRLLQLFHQVCMAMSFMHSRKLIHRDLKPQNIMIGRFGEVLILDFGLAKVVGPGVETLRADSGAMTRDERVQGTFAYMAPEQLIQPEDVNESSDQFALGAILYEILCYRPPYVGHGPSMIRLVMAAEFAKPRDIADVPESLQSICLKALAARQEDRYRSVGEFANEIQEFLDGEKELERREALAASYLAEAHAQLRRYRSFSVEADHLKQDAVRIRTNLPEKPTKADKARARRADARARGMAEERDRAFPEVLVKLTKLIDASPGNRRSREMLADFAMEKMLEFEKAGDLKQMATMRAVVESYHDGKYAKELKGDGSVSIDTDPPGAHVYLSRFTEIDGRLVPEDEKYLGQTPTGKVDLPMGSYILSLQLANHADTLYPFLLGRNEDLPCGVTLLLSPEVLEGFVYIPAGRFTAGGDVLQNSPLASRTVPGYCIGKNPITMREYLAFINDLAGREGMDVGRARSPRSGRTGPYYWKDKGDGTFGLPEPDDAEPWDPSWPVCGVSALDAEAYSAWRSVRDATHLRLPTSDEWEKAARGADGRTFPWGNEWDPDLCHSIESGTGPHRSALPEPVGRQSDASPYGVLGFAGNVSDWTSSRPQGRPRFRYMRGGNLGTARRTSTCSILGYFAEDELLTGIGFRLAYTPPRLRERDEG